ncbi:MAG TPA: hypothetical protein DCY88_18325 [Cyanobacteria bacterium UBA11372]|nr:hypothetical protein [Cyanobacteria bacterium UBA11372]
MKNSGYTSIKSYSNAEEFWRDWLRGFTAPLKLPAIAPSPSAVRSRETQAISLSGAQTSDLMVFAQNYQLTLHTLIQGAWSLLLSHYSGETEVLFGQVSGGVNTLPIRVALATDASVLSWLRDLEAQWAAIGDYASVPLAQIRAWSEVAPELPLFETLVIFETDCSKGKQDDYSLILSVDAESDLALTIDYDRSQFGDDAIARMLGHLETLLAGIIGNPEQCLAQIPLLTARERDQILTEWNQTEADYPKNKCIHQLFEEQVEKTPDAVAVVFEQQQLTYRELNCRANQLAQYLQKLGVKPEVLVGICVERSLEMVIGLLAILKAGGAYVPLDPAYPRDRLAFMLEDAKVSVLLTQQSLIEKLPNHQAKIICLDTDWKIIEPESQENPQSQAQPDNLAYIIYTSGSTGQPKGVLIPHSGLQNLVFWHQSTFKITPHDRATQLASIAFDASVWELWPYLTAGAAVYLVKSDLVAAPVELQEWLFNQQITVSFLPTPLAEVFLNLEWPQSTQLRLLLTGGDRLQRYPSSSIPFEVINNYGPTENTVVTTSGQVIHQGEKLTNPSIGRPIANTQIYLLDRYGQPVPIGVAGELHIGGVQLARGYLNRPELTAEKFIANPFNRNSNARLYKTGDIARYLPDGNIEFLERIDNQVKIRGFRIELAEIEAALKQHPEIQETVVIPREDIPGNKRLVAYIILRYNPQQESTNELIIPSQLHQFLKQKLPEYMVPSAFIVLESFPLTPNGKINRRALPAPDLSRLRGDSTVVPPRTPTEEILASFWREVLKVEPISIHDNFFELGGHSLLATQVVSRISQAFEMEVSIRCLFEAPTIVELSDRIESFLWAKSAQITSTTSDLELGEL